VLVCVFAAFQGFVVSIGAIFLSWRIWALFVIEFCKQELQKRRERGPVGLHGRATWSKRRLGSSFNLWEA
jgi:hypothetical protein